LLRTLACVFGISEVRKLKGRLPKALFLYGEGSNGKDTVKEMMSMLLGTNGVSCVTLSTFKEADKSRSFGLFPIVSSLLNWPSENKKALIDQCQTLKNAISGDEITVERKHEQSFPIKPKSVFIFNVNEQPAFETAQEAIRSRYGVMHFKNVFKLHPDPKNQFEKQANPRYKEDPKFIKEHILPALLNALIQAYKVVLKKGIDYTPLDDLMDKIRASNSHLWAFAKDIGLEMCPIEDGMRTSELHSLYRQWCIKEGYIVFDGIRTVYHHPSDWDKIVKTPNNLTPRLKKLFPHLEPHRTSKGSVLPLKYDVTYGL